MSSARRGYDRTGLQAGSIQVEWRGVERGGGSSGYRISDYMMWDELVHKIINRREKTKANRACLVGVSGIDASGKGHVAGQLAEELEGRGFRVALINVDGWLNLPHVRFQPKKAVGVPEGIHFYHHALRLDEMFSRLILPLKQNREIDLNMDYAEETATEFRPHTYHFREIDIILLEGIFIFKHEFAPLFDLKIWIDCSFETALRRAIERAQENLPPDETIAAYERIYFPAQLLHFEVDDPISMADVMYPNGDVIGR